ncbi:ShlB/FhaC/HecB family hemolysin secretion/activation protein [Kaarinaea lacus]
MLILFIDSAAAVEGIFPFSRPSDERPDIFKQQPFKPHEQPKLDLPPVEPAEPNDKQISRVLEFKLENVTFSGNTVFSNDQLQALVQPYIGKTIDTLDIQQIKNLITKHYIDNGYLNSGAVIPDQDIQDGILEINIIEGDLTTVNVSNKGRLRDQYISDRIRLDPHKPFNLYVLQERLYLLQQDPRIKRINADLEPGDKKGESKLNIEITEERPYSFLVQVDNHRPPSIGEFQGTLRFQHLNITGFGDKIDLTYNHTEGLNKGYINYQWPLTADDKILYAAYELSDSKVVTDEIKNLGVDLENESNTATIGFTMPFYQASTETLNGSLQLDKRYSKSYVDGDGFDYAGTGSVDGVTRITALRLIQNYLKFTPDTVLSFRHILSIGLDALDSTLESDNEDGDPDSKFVAWLAQFQFAKQYPAIGVQTVFRTDFQIADDNLMPMEEIAVGGATTVRGYRENQLVRDNGLIASLEVRKSIFQSESNQHLIQIAAFSDYGRAWAKDDAIETATIYSVGLGMRWQWNRTGAADLYWGKPLKDVNNPDDSLQDDGIHFKLVGYFP